MKYCIDYQKDFKQIPDADEITINFRRQDTSLPAFLKKYKDKTINIYIPDEDDFIENNCIEIFNIIHEEGLVNFVFKLRPYQKDASKLYTLLSTTTSYPYFFATFVHDWDTLWGYIDLHPSSIYITEDLGFEIKTVAEILHGFGIEVRCFPNVAQSSWRATPALKKFFIRPEDIPIYEKYVDVCEFFGKSESISTYLRIYKKMGKWAGKLKEIIIDFDSDINSKCILPSFATHRLDCGKRCLKNHTCAICDATGQLSAALEIHNLMIKPGKT